MRRVAFAVICVAVLASPALAVSEIGPIKPSNSQTELCMVKCSFPQDDRGIEPTCNFAIEWLDEEGEILTSKNFFDVPDQGSRKFAYQGNEKLVSCRAENFSSRDPFMMGGVQEPSIAILDIRGEVTAVMTNDRAMDNNIVEYCPACTDLCIQCVLCRHDVKGPPTCDPVCDSCINCTEE